MLVLVACNIVNIQANEESVNTLALIVKQKAKVVVPKNEGTISDWSATNKGVVKITKKKNRIHLKAVKLGKSVITVKTSKGTSIKYYVCVTRDSIIKEYKGSKIRIKIKKVKKCNHNVVLRVRLSNGKKRLVSYECGYKLQQKHKKKWKTKKTEVDIAGNGYTISGKSRIEFSVLLSNYYSNLKKGTYRLKFFIDGKEQYLKFKI